MNVAGLEFQKRHAKAKVAADNSFPGVKWCFPEEITEGRN